MTLFAARTDFRDAAAGLVRGPQRGDRLAEALRNAFPRPGVEDFACQSLLHRLDRLTDR